jgi:hypothetical protein
MARLFEIKDLNARKRALVAESEVYRECLKLEVQNLRVYGAGVRKRFRIFSRLNLVLIGAVPLLGGLLRRKQTRRMGALGLALKGWQLYRRFGPPLTSALNILLKKFKQKRRRTAAEVDISAADI